ncbi:MAG: exodeoxyribonuclease VII large subunit, partial [Chloroflexota bacterium]
RAQVGPETALTHAAVGADMRPAPPSPAAELSTPSAATAPSPNPQLHAALDAAMQDTLRRSAGAVTASGRRLALAGPARDIRARRLRLAGLSDAIARSWNASVTARAGSVAAQSRALRALDPEAVLARGYAVITPAGGGSPLVRASDASAGMAIQARLAEGEIDAWVTQTHLPKPARRRAAAR